jgi:hypothetical protein
MGFALWMKDGTSWAMGTHEYRPMGVAVISSSDYFRPRDFQTRHRRVEVERGFFVGFFASIAHMNQHLEKTRKTGKKKRRKLYVNGCELL